MRYRTTVLLHGRNTGIPVPDDVVEKLGAGKRPPVVLTIGTYRYRTTLASRDGGFLVPLSSAHREASGVDGGDEIEVEIAIDTASRTIEPPADLAACLAEDPAAASAWESLAPSHRKAHVEALESAKAPETRARRLEATLRKLSGS